MSPDTNSKNPSYLPPASIVKFAINTTARSQFKVPATSMCSSLQKSSVFSMRLVPELAGSSSYSVRSPSACTVSRHSWLPCAQLPPPPHSSCPLEAFKITQVIHQSHRSTPATYVIQIRVYIYIYRGKVTLELWSICTSNWHRPWVPRCVHWME